MSRAAPPPTSLASVYTRPYARGAEARQRIKAWGEAAVPRLRALGLDVTSCALEGERLAFVPDGRLTLHAAAGGLDVALTLAPRDVQGMHARLADPERALELTSAVEALPEQFTMSSGDAALQLAAASASTAQVRELIDGAVRDRGALVVGWTVPRATAVTHAATLDEQLADAVVVLGGFLALVAWVPAPAADARSSRPERRDRARRDDAADAKRKPRRDGRSRPRDRDPEPDGEVEPEAEQSSERESIHAAGVVRAFKKPLRPGLRRRDAPASGPVGQGSRVRVLEGAFAGKTGVVQELDGKGGARVLLGLLAVRIDVKDLVPWSEGRARPLLSSSHRKPLPVRS
jgi:hypothetical protein